MATSRSRVRMEIENLDEIRRMLDPEWLAPQLATMYGGIATELRGEVEAGTPRGATGELAAGWTHPVPKVSRSAGFPWGATFHNDVFYGRFVDQGTVFIRPRRFMRKAVTKTRPKALAAAQGAARAIENRWGRHAR